MDVKEARRGAAASSGRSAGASIRENSRMDPNLEDLRLPELGLPKHTDMLTELMTRKDAGSKGGSGHK